MNNQKKDQSKEKEENQIKKLGLIQEVAIGEILSSQMLQENQVTFKKDKG